jgi:hypothetical protein
MAILRAGPFATNSNSFVSIDGTWDGEIPVNCAKDDKSFWPWRAAVEQQHATPQFQLIPASSGSLSLIDTITKTNEEAAGAFIVINFYYQATEDWSFSGSSWKVSSQSSANIVHEGEVFLRISNATVFEDDDNISGANFSLEGDFDSVVFPASVVPVRVTILLSVVAADVTPVGSITATAEVVLPIDT